MEKIFEYSIDSIDEKSKEAIIKTEKKKLCNKLKKEKVIFDLYFYHADFAMDGTLNKKEVINNILKEVELSSQFKHLRIKIKEENFGLGADWIWILVEWFSKSDLVNALANFGGLLSLVNIFYSLWKKLKEKFKQNLKIGFYSARLIAIKKIFEEEIQIKEIEVLFGYERKQPRFSFNEKEFIFLIEGVSGYNKGKILYFVNLDWDGNIKSFLKI